MPLRITFDKNYLPELPTFVLATKSGKKLGKLNVYDVVCSDSLKDASEFSFSVNKYHDGKKDYLWDKIVDFKLVWCKEYDMWFEIYVQINEDDETVKSVSAVRLGHAELGQIMLYDVQINTEDDIARKDYVEPSRLYNEEKPEASILHRVLEKAPHYKITHVDFTIKDIQRTFEFNGKSVYDALNEIGQEIGCLFILPSNSDGHGKLQRTIEVYDAESYCYDCHHRGDFNTVCPKCGSTNIRKGFGTDTRIFVDREELGEDIKFTTDTDSVKNCFKLEAGDDLMTATVRNLNPNGTDYIWYITEDMKKDMSEELVERLESYDELFDWIQNTFEFSTPSYMMEDYNALVQKYRVYNPDLETLPNLFIGYPSLMNGYYNTVDLALYLESGLMPTVIMQETDASAEAAKLTSSSISPVAVEKLDYLSLATANSVVLSMAKVVVNPLYQVKIKSSALSNNTWTGSFTITNYSDEEDTAETGNVSVTITDDYEKFVKQKIDKLLKQNENDSDNLSISGLFKMSLSNFENEIKKYCLNSLKTFHDACDGCIGIMIEQGIPDKKTWSGGNPPEIYTDLYMDYRNKLALLEQELAVRQSELDFIYGTYDPYGYLLEDGMQTWIINDKESAQDILDFQKYLGDELWNEFCLYRREDKFSNDNYISDGLNNAELFKIAQDFYETARKEIYQSAELQHSITCKLKNLLVIEKFKSLIDSFEVGNWIRVRVDDNVYKLRLMEYEIDFDDLENITVKFSDVLKVLDGESDQRDLISKAASMASSYSFVKRQADKGSKSNAFLNRWVEAGLDITKTKIVNAADNQTQTWDSHGMMFREYYPETDSYADEQMKIINSTIAITDDNWKTIRTAVGKFIYYDPKDGQYKPGYGVIADQIVSNIVLSKEVGIYNEGSTITMDEDGLTVTNDGRDDVSNPVTVKINPNNNDGVFVISSENGGKVMWVDIDGNGHYAGALDIGTLSDGTSAFSVTQDGTVTIKKGGINLGAYDNDGSTDYKFKVDNNGNVTMTGSISWGNNKSPADAETNAKAVAEAIANGTYSGGTFINKKVITAPSIRGGATLGVGTNSNADKGYNLFIDSDGSLKLGANNNTTSKYNFYVDKNGNVVMNGGITLNGDITWGTGKNPVTKSAVYGVFTNQNDGIYNNNGSLQINASKINAGILNAGNISTIGVFKFVNPNDTSKIWGTIGHYQGSTTIDGVQHDTHGTAMFSMNNAFFVITTNAGARISNSGNTKAIYVDSNYATMKAGNAIVQCDAYKSTNEVCIEAPTIRFRANAFYNYDTPITISDRQMKDNISYDLEKYESFFMDLKPAFYNVKYGTSGRFHTGFIAPDVAASLDKNGLTTKDFAGYVVLENVQDDNGDYINEVSSLRYGEFVSLNTYMIQKALKKIESLEQEIKQLKGE